MKRKFKEKRIGRLTDLIEEVKKDHATWRVGDRRSYTYPWFRGESEKPTMYYDKSIASPLVPDLFRYEEGWDYENRVLQNFRMQAPIYAPDLVPPRDKHTDQWLFLARHVGLPTRLLDWTESLLMALYFAIHHGDGAVVWMLDWLALNLIQDTEKEILPTPESHNKPILPDNARPLTWIMNLGMANINAAWEAGVEYSDLPISVFPTYTHLRMGTQSSVFTIHGALRGSLADLIPARKIPLLYKYIIEKDQIPFIKDDLRLAGITPTVEKPDLDGLAADIADAFLPPKKEDHKKPTR